MTDNATKICQDLEEIAGTGEEDATIRRQAHRPLTEESHVHREERIKNVECFRFGRWKAAGRRADKQAQSASEKRTVDESWTLEWVARRRNRRCIGGTPLELWEVIGRKRARKHWRRVECGLIELWFLLKNGEAHGLVELNLHTCEITLEDGCDDDIDLTPDAAFAILDALDDASADDQEAFARVGAFSVFRNGRPEGEPVEADGREIRIWNYRNEIIVAAEGPEGCREWSRFSTGRKEWLEGFCNGMELGELFGLMTRHPKVAEKLLSPPIDVGR